MLIQYSHDFLFKAVQQLYGVTEQFSTTDSNNCQMREWRLKVLTFADEILGIQINCILSEVPVQWGKLHWVLPDETVTVLYWYEPSTTEMKWSWMQMKHIISWDFFQWKLAAAMSMIMSAVQCMHFIYQAWCITMDASIIWATMMR